MCLITSKVMYEFKNGNWNENEIEFNLNEVRKRTKQAHQWACEPKNWNFRMNKWSELSHVSHFHPIFEYLLSTWKCVLFTLTLTRIRMCMKECKPVKSTTKNDDSKHNNTYMYVVLPSELQWPWAPFNQMPLNKHCSIATLAYNVFRFTVSIIIFVCIIFSFTPFFIPIFCFICLFVRFDSVQSN